MSKKITAVFLLALIASLVQVPSEVVAKPTEQTHLQLPAERLRSIIQYEESQKSRLSKEELFCREVLFPTWFNANDNYPIEDIRNKLQDVWRRGKTDKILYVLVYGNGSSQLTFATRSLEGRPQFYLYVNNWMRHYRQYRQQFPQDRAKAQILFEDKLVIHLLGSFYQHENLEIWAEENCPKDEQTAETWAYLSQEVIKPMFKHGRGPGQKELEYWLARFHETIKHHDNYPEWVRYFQCMRERTAYHYQSPQTVAEE